MAQLGGAECLEEEIVAGRPRIVAGADWAGIYFRAGSLRAAAKVIGVSRSTLTRRLRELGMPIDSRRAVLRRLPDSAGEDQGSAEARCLRCNISGGLPFRVTIDGRERGIWRLCHSCSQYLNYLMGFELEKP